MSGRLRAALVAALLLSACGGSGDGGATRGTLRLATTSDARDAGLLGPLLDAFRAETGIVVRPLLGTQAEALGLVEGGDADLGLVRDDASARALLASGRAAERAEVAWSGPRDAPSARATWTALLVRRVPGASSAIEPSRRFFAWLTGPRARDVVRGIRVEGKRAFFLPDEPG
jgi:ABC-type tungstate transport system permease subunit